MSNLELEFKNIIKDFTFLNIKKVLWNEWMYYVNIENKANLENIRNNLIVFNNDYFSELIKKTDFNKIQKDFLNELLKYWKNNNLISFNDYLEIKSSELKLYKQCSKQSLWFYIQEEVWLKGHPFLEEIEKNKLEEKFLNWSDYCDKDLANNIIQKLKRIQNKKLNKIWL